MKYIQSIDHTRDIGKPECNLNAELHLNIINLVDTSDHQVNLNVCWSIRRIHRGRSYPGIIDFIIQNTVHDALFLQPLILLLNLSSISCIKPMVDAAEIIRAYLKHKYLKLLPKQSQRRNEEKHYLICHRQQF